MQASIEYAELVVASVIHHSALIRLMLQIIAQVCVTPLTVNALLFTFHSDYSWLNLTPHLSLAAELDNGFVAHGLSVIKFVC